MGHGVQILLTFAENVKGEGKSPTNNNLPLEKEVRELTQVVTKLADIMISSHNQRRSFDRTPSPSFDRNRSPIPQRRSFSPQRRQSSPGYRPNSPSDNSRDSNYFRQRSPSPGYAPRSTPSDTSKDLNTSGSSQMANAWL
jgi:hypothetical protein